MPEKKTILVAGDLAPLGAPARYLAAGDAERVFGGFLGCMQSADYFVANLECPLTDSRNRIGKSGVNLRASPAVAAGLKEAGVKALSLANNHIMDFGQLGAEDTAAALGAQEILCFGANERGDEIAQPLFVDLEGMKLGLLSYAEHEFNWRGEGKWSSSVLEPASNALQIRKVAAECDALVVLVHGGCENWHYPSPRIVRLMRSYAEAGASAVLMSHSHTIMGMEYFRGVPIAYGLGNFLFHRRGKSRFSNRLGAVASMTFERGKKPVMDLIPVVADSTTGCIDALNEEQSESCGAFMKFISEPLDCDENIEELWRCFSASQAFIYGKEMIRAFAAMVPGASAGLVLGKKNAGGRRETFFSRGANVLRGFLVCENHVEVLGQIAELLRERRLMEYRKKTLSGRLIVDESFSMSGI